MSFTPHIVKAPYLAPGHALGLEFNAEKPLVLVVEDHEDTRFMLKTILGMIGCQVIEAVNGLEAIEIAQRERPQLILIDGDLPLLAGLSAARLMREHPELGDVPIVATSGHVTPKFHCAALAAGCDDCLFKPFGFKELENLVGTLFYMSPEVA